MFARKVENVEPLPPAPLDAPVTDEGTLTVGNRHLRPDGVGSVVGG